MSFNNLIQAICENNEDTISNSINFINDTTINGFTPLIVSICKQYINITKILLNVDGIDINKCEEKNNSSPLYIAAQIGNIGIVKLLIENGADINLCNSEGDSPLIIASNLGHFEVAELLISVGANINHCDHANTNALYFASQNGYFDIVELIIKSTPVGLDFNIFNSKTDCNPLMASSKNGHLQIVKLLIGAIPVCADVNVYNCYGNTALIMASITGKFDIVKLLIENGANTNQVNNNGNNASYYALKNNHINIAELLYYSTTTI